MKWKMKDARFGDIVRVSLGSAIYHFGIFVTEDEIIQFGLPPTLNRISNDVEVLSAPVVDFLAGGFLEVGCPEGREKKRRKSPKETVNRARARLGERGYDIIHNNCEHFANECYFGERFSSMTDSLRAKFRAIPIVHVYVERLPFEVEDDNILPAERKEEIESCSNLKIRNQKYYVWKLLESALNKSFGLKMGKLSFKKEGARWVCDECCFSLSHSDDFVAVAVSKKPVGVDIEKCNPARFTEEILTRIATDGEREALAEPKNTALNALWTKKEAIFKMLGGEAFTPKNIEVSQYKTSTKIIEDKGDKYFITVAAEDADKAVFKVGGLTLSNFN